MQAQFEWEFRLKPLVARVDGRSSLTAVSGWRLLGGLTIAYLAWMSYRVLFRPVLGVGVMDVVTLVELAVGFTLVFIWTAVWWQQHNQAAYTLPQLALNELFELSPQEFEQYVARLFRHKGYRVKLRGRSGDQGVDLELIQRGGKRAVVQCKRYQRTISPDVVRDLYGTMMHERVAHAFLVTTADISEASRQWAAGKPITLIDGQALARIVAELEIGD
ncbi:MAG: restriction endonuclease [Ardenticatenaceae bacterium]|nr:restriction endonuclease [Ardenticatenaceae bacterium]